jgi:hypothetical protein
MYAKFVGRFSVLKEIGFLFKKLYTNQILYTTWENEAIEKSDVWIRKAGGYVNFDGYNYMTSGEIYIYLVNHNFVIPKYGIAYNHSSGEIRELNGGEYFGHIDSTGEWIRVNVKAGTMETLKKMWKYGWIEFSQ